MKKTYDSGTWQGFKMGLNLRGKPIVIVFDAGQSEPEMVTCKFTTDDEELQKVIEATRHFKIGKLKCINTHGQELSTKIEDVHGDKPTIIDLKDVKEEQKSVIPEAKVLKYKNWQMVADWIETRRGIDPALLGTPEDIAKVAKEQNITLPNLSE